VPVRWPQRLVRQRIAPPGLMKPLEKPVPEQWRRQKVQQRIAPPDLSLKPQTASVPGHWPGVLQ